MQDTEVTTLPVEERARQIADLARGMADQIDADRRLPAELVSALRDSGLLRAGAPVEVGALELPPGTALRCAEEVARGDASAGWCVSIAITSSLLVAYLPPASRDELFGAGRGVAAGVWAPQGKARPGAGRRVVSGRWAFCSGITHADVMFAGCVLDDRPAVVALPTEQLQILDTWHTLGLRGTGSHDAVADEVFVPDDAGALDIRRAADRPSAVPISAVRFLRRLHHRGRDGQRPRRDRQFRRARRREKEWRVDAHTCRAAHRPGGGRRRRIGAGGRAGAVLPGHRNRLAGSPRRADGAGGGAHPVAACRHPRGAHRSRRGAHHV